MFQPGSDQYPGITYLEEIIAFAALVSREKTCGEVYCVGMGRATLLFQYAKIESPPNGEAHYHGTGVDIDIEFSPYALDAQVPAGEAEWWPLSVYAPETVALAGSVNLGIVEQATVSFFATASDDTVLPFTMDISLPSHAQRLRVCGAEKAESDVGAFGCYVLLSLDPGGEYGWTPKSTQAESVPQ